MRELAILVLTALVFLMIGYGEGWDDGIARVCPLPATVDSESRPVRTTLRDTLPTHRGIGIDGSLTQGLQQELHEARVVLIHDLLLGDRLRTTRSRCRIFAGTEDGQRIFLHSHSGKRTSSFANPAFIVSPR
jgi:hypothetical protein